MVVGSVLPGKEYIDGFLLENTKSERFDHNSSKIKKEMTVAAKPIINIW